MATKHVLKISSIYEFFENDNKVIKKGENALESNHVIKMQFDAELMKIRGEIHASMKDKSYNVELELNSLGDIASATCNCPRGIKCHHIAALALFGHYNISVTDKECSWNVPKARTVNVPIKTAEEMYPSKPFKAVEESISEEQKNILRRKLSSFGNTVGFTWLLQEETDGDRPSTNIQFPVIEDIISSEEFKTSNDKVSCFKEKCTLEDDIINQIAEATQGQLYNETWYLIRKFRLTASNFGTVLSACQRKRYPPSLFKSLLGAYTLDGVKSIQWGRTHEKNGIEYMKDHLHLDVQETGIWLTKSGFLGASPDGLVGEDAIVEVKCPYSLRNEMLSNKLKNNSDYIISYNDNGEICININHNYYHQIQGNLHILKRKKCYLCIWTLKDVLVVLVEIDNLWSDNLQILENFYINEYFPKILES